MDYPDNPALHVDVQDYFGNETPPWLCCWVVMNQVDGQIEFHREESARYALPQLLPAKTLVDWVEEIVTHQDTRNIGFQQAVDAFIMRYSKSSTSLPMVRAPNPRINYETTDIFSIIWFKESMSLTA